MQLVVCQVHHAGKDRTDIGASGDWGQRCSKVLALSTCALFTTGGCGGCQRKEPMGGAAYRILQKYS